MRARASLGSGLPWAWGGSVAGAAADAEGCPEGSSERLVTRSTLAAASPEAVFLWVCQLRRAPYSYDWIDNFCRRSPRRAAPELTKLRVGQKFMTIFTLTGFVPGESVTLRMREGWPTRLFGAITLTYRVAPVGARRTRLVAAMWMPRIGRVLGRARRYLLAWGDLLMMRRQLLTLAALAEHERVDDDERVAKGMR